MSSKSTNIPSKTVVFISKVNKVWFIFGLHGLWGDDGHDKKYYKYIRDAITLCIFILIFLEYGAFFTQPHLTHKQLMDLRLFTFAHPIVIAYYLSLEYHKPAIRELFVMLHISLKNIYTDPSVEKRMIKRAAFFALGYSSCMGGSLVSYGFDGLMQVIQTGGTFTTLITAWPDVGDTSTSANVARVITYILWWVFIARISSASTVNIITSVALSHQYRNLQSYFYSLNKFFESDNNEMEQMENELKYIEALKVGIKLHSDTLWCTKKFQETGSLVISGQILINITVICCLLLQMMDTTRTLSSILAILSTIIAVLTGTGILMVNAGNVTVEAGLVATAMFSSGWHNCRGTRSASVRRLLSVAMLQGQKDATLLSFGVVEISYRSYLSIVKSSYSLFSILY